MFGVNRERALQKLWNKPGGEERVILIEIRTPTGIETTVWISSLKLRLPADHSWVAIPVSYWMSDDTGSDDLYSAFERGLIEVEIRDQSVYPDWYLNVIAPNIRVPEEFLEEEESVALEHLSRLRADAHSAVWAILRREFFTRELSGRNRESIVEFLQAE